MCWLKFKSNWSKWTVVQSMVPTTKTEFNPILGYEFKGLVFIDILKRVNNKTGEVQYKNVEL
jgi:hypothetical protein